MGKKYYAVREGRNVGIYNTWEECEAQVKGYSGASYKKFNTYQEAENFINDEEKYLLENRLSIHEKDEMVAYVDGSFDGDMGYYSCGAVIFTSEGKKTYSQKDNDENIVERRNVAGEIMGSMYAMEQAIKQGKSILYLYYDYIGIEKWAKGEWKTNKAGTQEYKRYYDSIKDKLKVEFKKVKAHSGDEYNEEADRLAKEALLRQ